VFILIGAAAGIVMDQLLRDAGLHWLVWPVIAVILLGAGLLQLLGLRARLRRQR
jgi:hypothetical protein